MSAGDDFNGGVTSDSAEIYEPPYLHSPRPLVEGAPTAFAWGASFDVATPDDDIAKAVLIAPGAATHAVDMNERYVPLEVTGRSPGRVSLRAPADQNLAPGGYYMLFLVDRDGVPSKARWVRLRAGDVERAVEPVPSPEPTRDPAPQPTSAPAPEPAPAPAVTAPTPVSTGTGRAAPAPTTTPASSAPAARSPAVQATLVRRRGGRRAIRVVVGRSSARRTARVRIVLRDRRGRVVARLTRTLRTGRATVVFRPRVPPGARTASVRLLS